jgi:hypothetical protein
MADHIKSDRIIDTSDALVLTATGRLMADRIVADLLA